MEALPQEVDVLVVGAGQAGLGAAYRLTRAPALRVLVLDRADVVVVVAGMEGALPSVIGGLVGTPLVAVEPLLPDLDLVLLMSVNPGFGGQAYLPGTTARLRTMREMRDAVRPECLIELDGGVKASNIALVGAAGADIIVVGSALYNGRPVKENLDELHREIYA